MIKFNHKQIHTRGYLTHVDGADYQFITYRLFDSLPKKVIEDMVSFEPVKKFKAINHYLDQGLGSCLLNNKQNAEIVIENWQHFDGSRYDIIAYVVMPNHVHILIKVYPSFKLSSIIHSWKSYTAKKIKADGGSSVWFREYYDRFIRDESHFNLVIEYIAQNPVKAGLVKNSVDWPYLLLKEL